MTGVTRRQWGGGQYSGIRFQFATFVAPGYHTAMQREAGHLPHCPAQPILGLAGGQRLQGKDLATSLRAHRDSVGDGIAQQLIHGAFIGGLQVQIAVFGIALDQSSALQIPTDAAATRAVSSQPATVRI